MKSGCYSDGARGIYQGEHIQHVAIDLGWPEKIALSDHEHYYEVIDEAIDYLNNTCALVGHYWGNNENGNFGLWEN